MCSLPEIAFADPDADDWAELPFSRVVLSNENLRVRIRVRPAVPDAATFKTILGGGIMLAADETSPDGVFFPLDDIPGSHGLSNLWPSFLLGAGYVSYLCEQRRPEDGYAVATNLLSTFQALGIQEPDSPLWNHAKRHLGMGDATLYETILFATAAAAFDSGRSVAATNLSQSIPARLRELVFEHEWDE